MYLLDTVQAAAVERKKLYSQLCKRIEREKQLTIIAQKMETKKLLLVKTDLCDLWPVYLTDVQ